MLFLIIAKGGTDPFKTRPMLYFSGKKENEVINTLFGKKILLILVVFIGKKLLYHMVGKWEFY